MSVNGANFAFGGDYDGDLVVDGDDLAVWTANYGSTDELAADGNCNGMIEGQDFLAWQRNFGRELSADFDFGDAPESYGTTLADDGARHLPVGPTLGLTRDADFDGVPSDLADADGADEDGIIFSDPIQVGALGVTAFVDVFNSQGQATKLDAWIDFNGDGSFGGIGEQIFSSLELAGGIDGRRLLRFDVPSFAVAGEQIARFRLSTEGDLGPTGAAADGEVEDYVVTILGPTPSGGLFAEQPAISDSELSASSVSAADINGDRDLDVVSSRGNEIVWHRGFGGGFFAEEIVIDTYDANVSASIAADLDGDGDVDVISATNFQNFVTDRGVFWHENDGNGNFTRRQVSSAGVVNRVVSLFVSDVDGDGDQDILAITNSTSGNNVSVLVNNGSQSFSVRAVGTASFGQSVFGADVDSDGDIDVVTASRNDDKIAWFENRGDLTFQEHVLSTSANGGRGVFAVDVDGDGDTDVLSASNQDSTVAWYENDGDQNFTERVISTSDRGAFSVFAADYDGDGDIDVLSAANGDGELVLHVNDGDENFTKRVIASGLSGAQRIFTADVDGDGDLDALAASSTAGSTVSWFENLGLPSGVFGVSDVFLNGNRSGDLTDPADLDGLRTQETNLGNLVADASLATARAFDPTVVGSFRNAGSIRASIGTTFFVLDTEIARRPNANGFISQEDIETTLAFNNGLTLLDITRADLVALLEEGISALPAVSGDFPQISGLKFSFDESRPAGDRVVSAGIFGDDGTLIAPLAEGSEVSGDPDEVFRIVTSDFLANSGSPVLVSLTKPNRVDLADLDDDGIDDDVFSGGAIFAANGTEQDALAEYLLANFDPENGGAAFDEADTSREFDERIQNLSFRSDDVLPPSEVFDNGAGGVIGFTSAVLADVAQGQLNAEDVVLAETTLVDSIAWSGVYLNNSGTPAAVDDFTILIYADDNGQPASGDPVAEFVVGNNVNRTPVGSRFSYTADISFVMDAGVTYWVSLLDDTTGDPADFGWGNQTGGGNQHFSDDGGETWDNGGQQPDFRLFGTTAAPLSSAGALSFATPLLGESSDSIAQQAAPTTPASAQSAPAAAALPDEPRATDSEDAESVVESSSVQDTALLLVLDEADAPDFGLFE